MRFAGRRNHMPQTDPREDEHNDARDRDIDPGRSEDLPGDEESMKFFTHLL